VQSQASKQKDNSDKWYKCFK